MASVIRRVRRTRVKLEHGYDVGAWRRHGSMHPDAVRKRAAMSRVTMAARSTKMGVPAVVDRLTRVHEQLDGIKAELFDAPQPEGPRDATDLVDAYPAH